MKKLLLLTTLLLTLSLLTGCTFLSNEEVEAPALPDEQAPPEQEEQIEEPAKDESGQLKPWFTEEPSIYIKLEEDGTQRNKTQYHEYVQGVKATIREAFRHTNNMQTVTPAEKRAIWSYAYWKGQTERFGEPFEELMVRDAIERNWVAKTENEIIEHIIFTPDGAANVRMTSTITFISGNFDGLSFSHELNKPYHQHKDKRFVFEDGMWKLWSLLPVEANAQN